MKTRIILLTVLLLFTAEISADAWISVPDKGDTGWRTYTYQAGPTGFTGTAGFVVSNVIDNSAFSELLLDNLSQGGDLSNRGFELRNYSGYNFLGSSCGEVTDSVIASGGNLYNPTQGAYFSHQMCLSMGVDTSAFRNGSHQTGTTGSILESAISLPAGGTFKFDWAFLAGDLSPWNDFALFYLKDSNGNIVFLHGLAQVGSFPALPPGILLLLE